MSRTQHTHPDGAVEKPLTLDELECVARVWPLARHDDEVEGRHAVLAIGFDLLADDSLDRRNFARWRDARHVDSDDPRQVDEVDHRHLRVEHVEHDDAIGDDAARLACQATRELVHAVLHVVVAGGRRDGARKLVGLRIVPALRVGLGGDDGHGDGRLLLTRGIRPPQADVDGQASAEGLLAREEGHADELLKNGRFARALVADDDDLWRRQVDECVELRPEGIQNLEHRRKVLGHVGDRARLCRRRNEARRRLKRDRACVGKILLQPLSVPLDELRLILMIVVAQNSVEGGLPLGIGFKLWADRDKPIALARTNDRRGAVHFQVALNCSTLVGHAVLRNDRVEHDHMRERAVEISTLRMRLEQCVNPSR